MRVILKWSVLGIGAVFTVLQIVPPPVQPLAQATAPQAILLQNIGGHEVGSILNRACKDCHSNETAVPWYGHVAPVSWMLTKHVRDGRNKLNFSDWDSRKHSSNEMQEICDAVSNGSMPLRGYTMIHRDARLSKRDVDSICNWADASLAKKYVSQYVDPPVRRK
jgi:hypothetical protein